MGNFNLKSIWKQTGGTGGSTNLEQRVQAIENNFARKKGVSSQNIDTVYHFNQPASFHDEVWIGRVSSNSVSAINKQYLEQQLTATKNQIRSENNTFTGTNTFNNGFTVPNSAEAYVEKDITNANDNQIVNYKGFYWKRIGQQNNISLNNGATSAFNTTTSELRSQKHVRIMLRITPNNYDYTMVFDLTLNNLGYKNFGEVKTLHWADNTLSNLDPNKFIYVTVAQYQNNTIRVNIRNASGATINTGNIYTYIQTIKPKFQL